MCSEINFLTCRYYNSIAKDKCSKENKKGMCKLKINRAIKIKKRYLELKIKRNLESQGDLIL